MKNNEIPKTIHYCWFGGEKLGKKEKECIKSWKRIMPEYKIIKWDEKNYDVNKNEFIKEAYDNKKWAFVSDYARLDIIYNYGGIYFDTDVEVIKKFDDLLKNECFMGFENSDYVATGLGFGAKKNNQFVKMNMDVYEKIKFDITNTNNISCPKITTKLLKKNGFIMNNKFQKSDIITLYPSDYFCPKNYYTNSIRISDNTHSIHHYSMTWLSKRDIRWHKINTYLTRFFGKRLSNVICLFLKTPGSFLVNWRSNGFKKTIYDYNKKLRGFFK